MVDVDGLLFLLRYWIVYSDHYFFVEICIGCLMPYTHTKSPHSPRSPRPNCSTSTSVNRNMKLQRSARAVLCARVIVTEPGNIEKRNAS